MVKNMNLGEEEGKERGKPDLITRHGDTVMSIWITENKIRLSVSRKKEGGFEKVGVFVIPVDYMVFKILMKNPDIVKKFANLFGGPG